jgi:hypothetical protein
MESEKLLSGIKLGWLQFAIDTLLDFQFIYFKLNYLLPGRIWFGKIATVLAVCCF